MYAGVFDPPTLAHMAIIETALKLFDRLVVVVAVNPDKSSQMFSTEARVDLLRQSIPAHLAPLVEVMSYAGLTAPYAARLGACAFVRAVRPMTDADYEIALALMNAKLAPDLPTVLLVARADQVYLSSSFVRQTATMDGLIVPGTVPEPVAAALEELIQQRAARSAAGST